MAKVIFDGVNRLVIIDPGIIEIDVRIDLYSDWKEWALLSDNIKYFSAFRATGGDPISATKKLGAGFFITNGWRIRPPEEDIEIVFIGNLFAEEGKKIFARTVGDFNARTIVERSADALELIGNFQTSDRTRLNQALTTGQFVALK